MAVIDHLVLAVPDLDVAIDDFEREHGVRPATGGHHEGLGTHNALVSFGASYLELIAPDPSQPDPDGDRPFGVDAVDEPTVVTFAVRPDVASRETIESLVSSCRTVGHDPGTIVAMSRRTPNGELLDWRLTVPTMTHDGLVPFLIDWGDTVNPAASAPGGLSLASLSGGTGEPAGANAILRALALTEFAQPLDRHPPACAPSFAHTPQPHGDAAGPLSGGGRRQGQQQGNSYATDA